MNISQYNATITKNDDSSLCYDVSIRIKILKIDKFDDFSFNIDYNSKQTYQEL